MDKNELKKGIEEEKEHTDNLQEREKIAKDHLREDPKYYTHLEEMKKKYKVTEIKHKLVRNYSECKNTGLNQIPLDYKKTLNKAQKLAHHWKSGKSLVAEHSFNTLNSPADIIVTFMREGNFVSKGKTYQYDWEILERDKNTFLGRPLYLNHSDEPGTEIGRINKVYVQTLNGIKWLCAKISFANTKNIDKIIDLVEQGILNHVSTTHEFFQDPNNLSKVTKIYGKGISIVSDPEIKGARILKVMRNT